MHNLKDLRKNLKIYKNKFKDRNLEFNVDEFNQVDKIYRELINKKELLEQEKKILSKSKDHSNFKKSISNKKLNINLYYKFSSKIPPKYNWYYLNKNDDFIPTFTKKIFKKVSNLY